MNKEKAQEYLATHRKALEKALESQSLHKICRCNFPSALYFDFGMIKCQRCSGLVDMERAKKYIDFNTERRRN